MERILARPFRVVFFGAMLCSAIAMAQEAPVQQPANPVATSGWRRVDDPPQQPVANETPEAPAVADPAAVPPAANAGDDWRKMDATTRNRNDYPAAPTHPKLPEQLTIPNGANVVVRINERLSSDHNKAGDTFTATLLRPIIVNDVVVARRGQVVAGRVVDAKRAGHASKESRLALQLTALTTVDGQMFPLQSQLFHREFHPSRGGEAGAIGGTTAAGALIGASVGLGAGAVVGAAAGAFAGMLGVLSTRGRPTLVGPETILTFRLVAPVVISTTKSPLFFRYATQSDYGPPPDQRLRRRPPPRGYAPNGPPPTLGPGS